MKHLPRSLIALLVYLTVLYNLERISIAGINLIDIKGFVYALVIIIILLELQVDYVRKQSISTLMLSTLLIYLIGKFLFFRYWTVWGEESTYLIITEIVLIWIAVLLSHKAGTYIYDFEEAVKNISFNGIENINTLSKTTEDIRMEMYRSRRYGHPLTIVTIEPETSHLDFDINIAIKEVQLSMIDRYYKINMARALHQDLRFADMIIDIDKGKRFAIIYPETSREDAIPLIERIYKISKKMGITMRAGISSFPEDAITFEELLRKSADDMVLKDLLIIKEEETTTNNQVNNEVT